MSIIYKIKKLLNIKDVPIVESIETYEDVNAFLEGYKHYFEKLDSWYFIARVNGIDQVIINKIGCRYFVGDNNFYFYEPNIRAYIWDNRDIINAELKRRKERTESEERERIRKEELESQIKTFK
jgi:hypothetical protein